jgi:hypothetical protein
MRPSHDEVGEVANSKRPNFTVMTFESLNVLELNRRILALPKHG